MSNFWEAAPIAGQQPQQPQTPPPQPAANFWEQAPVAQQPAQVAPSAPPALAVDPSAVSNEPPRAELVAPGSVPGSPVSDGAAALGYGTARSIAPAVVGGATATAVGAGLTATGVGAPVGIPLAIVSAFLSGYGTRVGQDKLIPPSEEEQRLARENPTLYNTVPAIATMPLGGGRFGVQNIKDLGTAVSAARAGRVLTEAEKAAAISAATQVGVNAAIPAASRAYNVSQGGEFGIGDYLLEAGAAPFVGGKSYRPVQAVQDVAGTVGFKAADATRRGVRSVGQRVGVVSRPTAAGEVNQPGAQFNGVDLVMPEGFNPIVWGKLTDEGRFNAIKDFEAQAAAQAAQAQASQPEPTPMAPPAPEQGTLPVPPAAEAPAPAAVPETPAAPQAEAPAPKPAPTARPAQTEIPGAEDAFNLAPEQTRTPAPEPTADTTPDLVQPTEPSYVGPARKRLADLETQGKGESPEAVGLREVIRGSKPVATPEATPTAVATPAPQEAAPAPKPLKLVAKIGGVDIEVGSLREASVRWMRAVREIEQGGRSLNDPSMDKLFKSGGPRVLDENGNLVGFIADNGTIYTATRRGANDGKPVYRPTEKDYDAAGYGRPNDVEIDSPPAKLVDKSTPAPKPARLVKGKPSDIEAEIDAKKKQVETQQKRVTEADENQAMEDDSPASQRRTKKEEEKLRRLENELKELEAEAKRSPDKNTLEPDQAVEPVDVQRARKYIEEQSQRGRPQSRKKLREAEDVVEQYETDSAARVPGNKLGDSEIVDVSDDTLTEIADGYTNRENAGDTLTPEESQHKQQVEKELLRRFQTDESDVEGELNDNQILLDQGHAAIFKGVFLPRLPKQYKADQIAGYLGNASKRLQRLLFRNPPGIKIKKNPTREEIEAARRAADAMVGDWHELAGQNNRTFDPATTNSDEAVNAFIEAANNEGSIKESGLVPRRYKTIAEDMAAESQPPVRDTDEAMPDVEVDPETGATIRTEEVDPAEAALAGRDDTPLGVMPKNLDDGQGGRTLQPDKNGEGGIVEKLDKAADDILGPPEEGRMHSVSPPVITAMVWRTARAMQKGAVDVAKGFKSWSSQFVKTYGSNFKAYAQYIWDAAKNAYQAGFVNFKPRFLAGIAEKANQVADRNTQSPAAKLIASIIFNRPGAKTAGEGMGAPMRIESAQARVRNKLAELAMQFRDKISQMTDSERAMFNKLARRIHEGNAPMPKGWVGDFVRGMRDILRNDPDAGLLAQQKAGIDIGDVGETYFPRNLDSNMVKAREAEFIKAATEAYKKLWNRMTEPKRLELFPELGTDPATRQPVNDAFFEAKAREYYNRVTERVTDGDLLPMFEGAEGTKARVTKERVFNNDEAALFDEFYTNDYLGDIERYLASAARRKVSAEAIGPNGEKLADLSQRMAAEGVPPDDRREMRDLLKKALGIGRQSETQMTAGFFDATGFLQGSVMLGRSFWNNVIQEPMQIGIRASTKPMAIDAPINILRAYKDTYTNFAKGYFRLNPDQARRYRQALGKNPAFADDLDTILSEELGLNGFNDPSFYADTSGDFGRDARGLPALRRLTNKIFEINLLSPTEAAKVTASVTAARRFLADNLRFAAGQSKLQKLFDGVGIDIGGKKVAKLYLSEIGIKDAEIPQMLKFVDDIEAAQKNGGTDAVLQLISGNDPMAARYREALGTFSRQSSVKPSRATKPEFQDEGLGRMFLQLKGFSYDFEQSINLRRWGLMKEAVSGKNWGLYDRAVMAGPLLGMPLTVAATAGKFALINMLYPSEGTKRRKDETEIMKGLDAASYEGVFGPFFESLFKTHRQQTPIGGAAGQVVTDLSRAAINAASTDSNTNAPERQIARTGYRNVVKPAIAAASTVLPKPLGVATNIALGTTQPEEKFVDETAGKKGEKDKKQRGW